VLLGPPGVGKGTQADMICEEFGTCHLSTGDVFRAARAQDPHHRSPALVAAIAAMERGDLVSDDVVLEMVRERGRCLNCGAGFLLDGFPRTVPQAEALDALLESADVRVDAVLYFDLPESEIVARLSGRRTCVRCKSVFHITQRPPQTAGVCDLCGCELVQRVDDRPESIAVRMKAFEASTRPLIEYYQQKGRLIRIKAHGRPEAVFNRTLRALDAFPVAAD
jgi:adenylate kinase